MPLLTTSSFDLRPRTIVRGGTHNSFLSVMHLTRVGLPIYRATVVSRRMSPQLRRRAWRQFGGECGRCGTQGSGSSLRGNLSRRGSADPTKRKKKCGAQNGVRARKVRNVLYGDVFEVKQEASPKDLGVYCCADRRTRFRGRPRRKPRKKVDADAQAVPPGRANMALGRPICSAGTGSACARGQKERGQGQAGH